MENTQLVLGPNTATSGDLFNSHCECSQEDSGGVGVFLDPKAIPKQARDGMPRITLYAGLLKLLALRPLKRQGGRGNLFY